MTSIPYNDVNETVIRDTAQLNKSAVKFEDEGHIAEPAVLWEKELSIWIRRRSFLSPRLARDSPRTNVIAHASLSPIQFRYKENAYCLCKTLLFAHCSTFNELDIFNDKGGTLT